MKHRYLLLLSLLSLLGATRGETDFHGKFALDLQQWRAEALRERPQIKTNNAMVPMSKVQREKMINFIGQLIGSATLEIRKDGTYTISAPLFSTSGTWKLHNNQLVCITIESHMKLSG